MSADTELESMPPGSALADEAAAVAAFVPESDRAARLHLVVASLFLALTTALGLVLALHLAFPSILDGIGFLSYGRALPMATTTLLYGWLAIGSLGAMYYVLPRVGRSELATNAVAGLSLGFLAAGTLAGTIAIGAGFNEGRRYTEMPLWADAVYLIGLLIAAAVVTRTVAGRHDEELGASQVFMAGAAWWLPLTFFFGNLPGISGIESGYQSAFYQSALFGLGFAAAGIGIVYYLLPRLSGRRRSGQTSLSVLGFWSLALVWAATAPGLMTYSPIPDWLETVGVMFSIALIVPVIVIFADMVYAMRGRWHLVEEAGTVRFLLGGAVLFALVPLHQLLMALRSSSTITRFTEWSSGLEFLALYGAFTFWLLAFAYHVAPRLAGRRNDGHTVATWHFRLAAVGIGITVAATWIPGLQTALTWVAGANDGNAVTSFGDGFISTASAAAAGFDWRLIGFALFAVVTVVGAGALAGAMLGAHGPSYADLVSEAAVGDDAPLLPPVRFGRLKVGAIGLYLLAALLVWWLPSLERHEPTLLADTARAYPAGSVEAQGRAVYIAEGCWYCHTQEVRPIVTDVDLGPVSVAGDYVHETPALFGVERVGPDLMHAGSRDLTGSAVAVAEHLVDPRAQRPWSTMPSYEHLSAEDLQAVAVYISSLR